MKCNALIVFLLCICIFVVSEEIAHAATPQLDTQSSLGPTAARVGERVAIFGTNLSLDATFKFGGGVMATSARYIDPSIDGGSADPNRILVTVPKGARSGRIQVCNENKCVLTKEKLTIISNPLSRTSRHLLSPHTSVTYRPDDVVYVKYRTKQWRKEDVLIYLDEYHSGSAKNGGLQHSQLVGRTSHKRSFKFVLDGESGTGDNIFKVKVCNVWCEISDSSDNYFSIKE